MKKYIFAGIILLTTNLGLAGEEGMTTMPKIQPKDTYTIKSTEQGEDLQDQRGFGDKESEVRMMNLMMVEGSGYEGMDMASATGKVAAHSGHEMKMAQTEKDTAKISAMQMSSYEFEVSPSSTKVGANVITVTIRDATAQVPISGLKPKAQVYMRSMDMGTDEPRVREVSPGKYQLKATFSMRGPWAVKLMLPKEEKILNFEVSSSSEN